MSSVKLALMLAKGATPVAPEVGKVLLTLGGVVSGQPTTVKDACAVSEPLRAVLVNEPHFVGVATMVSVKGAVGLDERCPHVTVFPLVLHVPAGATELTVNPDGNRSLREF
jgi:hypothetical protein